MWNTIIRVANVLFLLAFLLSAAVQLNDPDPLAWMVLYGAAALACGFFARGRLPRRWPVLLAVVAGVWSLYLVRQAWGGNEALLLGDVFGRTDMVNERVELVREAGGLAIVVFWMLVLATSPDRRAAS